MASESVILTALPNGMHESGDRLQLTVFVSPRLSTDGDPSLPLKEFPAFRDWPAVLAGFKFHVEFEGIGVFDAEPDPASSAPDSSTWRTVFDEDKVGVVTGEFTDLSDRTVRTFPANEVAAAILDLYADVAEGFATSFPPVKSGPLVGLARELGNLADGKQDYYASLDGLIGEERGPGDKTGRFLDRSMISPGNRTRLAFLQAYRFYDRPGSRDPLGPDAFPDKPKPPEIDFHGYCAFLGDYPKLLRPLGLAIDLLVELPQNLDPQGRVRLLVSPDAPEFMQRTEARPWTNYELADRRWLPEPRQKEGPYVDGMLRLDSQRHFDLQQVDVDGSALKTVDFAANLLRMVAALAGGGRTMADENASVPALRTGGFTVTHTDRARSVVEQFDTAAGSQQQHASAGEVELYAEDLTRGYRVEVRDTSQSDWRSLCERTGSYVVRRPGGDVTLPIPDDEGYLKGSSTTSVPGDDDLYLHEAVFGWDGWSAVVKRLGQTIVDPEDATDPTNPVGQPEPEPPPDFPLVTSFRPRPGSLPRLRFGTEYELRARLVDLAGNSIRLDDVVEHHVTPARTFRRFDPVPSPAVIPRRRFTEGESLMRMVIRSTLGIPPGAYVDLDRVTNLPDHSTPATAYLDINERHLAAPKSSQQLAEWHAMFELAIGLGKPQVAVNNAFDISSRESGSYIDNAPGAFVVNTNPGQAPTNLATHRKGDPLQQGEYVCHDTDDLAMPYLPDVFSLGASLTTLPGDSGTRLQPWEGAGWPDRRPLRIRIVDGGGTHDPQQPVVYDQPQRLLTVFLRQAEKVTVSLSSFLPRQHLDIMAVWMLESPAAQNAQLGDASAGRHWMLTPSAPLTLVHAVEKPLEPPVVDVDEVSVTRNEGETFAVLGGAIVNHAKSTGRLDIEARWKESIDDLRADAPNHIEGDVTAGGVDGRIDGSAHVADFQLEATEDSCHIGRDDIAPTAAASAVHKVRHEFKDTKHRRVTYHAVATTRFREYFPPQITENKSLITHVGPDQELIVRSSRRPDPPQVLYVVPTFTWDEQLIKARPGGALGLAKAIATRTRPTLRRRRSGGGLRIYLDRPWYSSGDGELLAVVLADQPWLTWPIDLAAGLTVDALAKTHADLFADRLIAAGGLRPRPGRPDPPPELPPSHRLTRLLGAELDQDDADDAEASDERRALRTALSAGNVSLLAGLLGGLLLPIGDPEKYLTRWGADPAWGADPPPSGPYIHQFPLRAAVGTKLSLAEVPGATVTAVGHKPEYDKERKLWYCDIEMDAGTAYFPFVRLGLARYQPHSIPGCHLSRVVFPEWAQLVAERTASVTRDGERARLTLRGPGGYSAVAVALLGREAAATPDGIAFSRFAVAQVERLPAGATSDLAWIPVGDEVRLALGAPNGVGDIRYTGAVSIPKVKDGEQVRVALQEYEVYETDDSQAEDHLRTVRRLGDVGFGIDRPVRYRLVYADHLPV